MELLVVEMYSIIEIGSKTHNPNHKTIDISTNIEYFQSLIELLDSPHWAESNDLFIDKFR